MTDRSNFAREHLLPTICVIAASLALGFAPFLYGKLQTGDWSAPNQFDIEYYLQIAAQPYFDHVPYLSDPSVPGGAIFYPWLQFVPAAYLARAVGLNVFSIAIVWTVFAAVAMAAMLYGLFWYFLRRRWLAAGLTIAFLADASEFHPFFHHIRILIRGLLHPQEHLPLELFHFHLTNPALDLPFLFVQVLALAAVRNRPNRLRVWISGASFGLLFYVYFYAWTIAAAALVLAFLIDKEQRSLYARTFAIGFTAGAPAIVRDLLVRRALSAEGLIRFGLFATPIGVESLFHGFDNVLIPGLCVPLIVWIVASRKHELIFPWCLAVAGLALSYSYKVTGIYLHDYHWGVLFARPIFSFLIFVAIATVVTSKVRVSGVQGWMWGSSIALFFLTGLYVSTLNARQMRHQMQSYSHYKAQRLAGKAAALSPRTMIGGDDDFCGLAVIGENMRALAGSFLSISMALKDSDLYARYALNQYLNGVSARGQFRALATGYVADGRPDLIDKFVRAFDEVSSDPLKFLDAYDVRYVALRKDQSQPAYIKDGWLVVEDGPYWRIWQRPGRVLATDSRRFCCRHDRLTIFPDKSLTNRVSR